MLAIIVIIWVFSLIHIIGHLLDDSRSPYNSEIVFGIALPFFAGTSGYLGWQLFKLLVRLAQ